MISVRKWVVIATLVLAIVLGHQAAAQEFRGTISGEVKDPSGAVIPSAAVTVREVHTGAVNRTKSDASGQYVVPFLLPGEYSVTVDQPGFQSAVRERVTLQSQEHPIINFSLRPGSETQTVTVSSDPPLIDQANASVGEVIPTSAVEAMPVNGRTPALLTGLAIGVINTSEPGKLVHPFDNNAGSAWSIGGTPNQSSEILLDGSPDAIWSGSVAYSPTLDSTQEVSVRAFDTDASFGHTLGGVINQITKSGTNALHGSLYEFSVLSPLSANSFFNGYNNNPPIAKSVFHFHQFGGTIGGPIWIPKVVDARNKLFFFFAYEGLKEKSPGSDYATVPTDDERAGNFYQTLAAGCPTGFNNDPSKAAAICNPDPALGSAYTKPYADPNQLYNPYAVTASGSAFTRAPILRNNLLSIVPSLNSVGLAYLNLFPHANTAGNASGQQNYYNNAYGYNRYDNEFGRLDWNASSRNHVFFDFRHNQLHQGKQDYFGTGLTDSILFRENYGAVLDEVFTLNSTTIFDVRANWTYFDETHSSDAQNLNASSVGLPQSLTDNSLLPSLPYLSFATSGSSCSGQTSFQCLGYTGSNLDPSTNYQIFANMVKILGRHTLKVGLDAREYRLSVQNFGNAAGSFTLGDNFLTSGSAGAHVTFGADLATLLLGLPTGGSFDRAARADYRSYYYGSFVQEDWRVNDELTLNLGLRFDVDTPYGEKFGRTVSGFDPNAINSTTTAAAVAYAAHPSALLPAASFSARGGLVFPNGNGGAPYQVETNLFSPRFGFSYSPAALKGRTTFRGGFAIFVDPPNLSSPGANGTISSNAITNQQGFSATTSLVATNDSYQTVAATLSNPFPNGFAQPVGPSLGASTFLGQGISFVAPVEHDIYSERWNLDIQHSLTPNTLVEALYVGNHGVHLPIATQNINAVESQYLSTKSTRDNALNTAYTAKVTNPFAGLLPGTSYNGATTQLSNLLVPYPQFGASSVNIQNQTIGQSYFEEGAVRVQHRASHGLFLTANYSFSKFLDAVSFLNDSDPTPTRRVSPYDHTHHFVAGGSYQLPFGRGKHFSLGKSRLLDEIAGGWVVNAIYTFQTGAPVYFSNDVVLQPGVSPRDISIRNRGVYAGNSYTNASGAVTSLNTSQYDTASADQFVFHQRTFPTTLSWVRLNSYNNLDASVLKDFHFTEKAYFQLRLEAFNALNHPVFGAPNVSPTSGTFGQISSQDNSSRSVQIGGRISF